MKYAELLPLVAQLADRRAVVIGDVILDEYLIGRAERLSREAPIPVLEFERREMIPGGAANPSATIARLGSQAVQIGVVGRDEGAAHLRQMLEAQRIQVGGLVADPTRPTTTKTRILAQMGLRFPQQVARIDRMDRRAVGGDIEAQVCEAIHTQAADADVVVASDYLIGLLTPRVVTAIREAARSYRLLTVADAQGELHKYSGFDLVKCNADEASRYVRRGLKTTQDFESAGADIAEALNVQIGVLITRGPDGITLIRRQNAPIHIPAPHIEDVYDTVGAGDTVVAIIALAVAAGIAPQHGAMLANLGAGIVIRKVGNYAPSPDELRAAIREQVASPAT